MADLQLWHQDSPRIAGSVVVTVTRIGQMPAINLASVTSEIMSIPVTTAISKVRILKLRSLPVWLEGMLPLNEILIQMLPWVILASFKETYMQVNVLHAFSQCAVFGLVVGGQILWVQIDCGSVICSNNCNRFSKYWHFDCPITCCIVCQIFLLPKVPTDFTKD